MSKNITHALVRFRDNNPNKETSIIPLGLLKSYEIGTYKPKNVKDFQLKPYAAKKKKSDENYGFAEICALGTIKTLKTLQETKKRIPVKKLNLSDANESLTGISIPTSTNSCGSTLDSSATEKQLQKESNQAKRECKRKLENSILQANALAQNVNKSNKIDVSISKDKMQNKGIKSNNSTSNEPKDAKSKKNNQLGKKMTSSVLQKNSVESDSVNSDLSEIEETEETKETPSTKVNAHNPKNNEKLSSNSNLYDDAEASEHNEEIHEWHDNELKRYDSDNLEDDHTKTVYKNKEVKPSNKITETPIQNTPKKPVIRKRAASTALSCLDDEEEDCDDAFQGCGSSGSHRKDGAIWTKEIVRNGKLCNMKMVHLGRGISIPLHNWEIVCKKAKTRSLFIKNLVRNMYGCERLANRCVSGTQKCTKVTNRDSPRKPFTPKKIKVIKNCYRGFLTNIKPSLLKEHEDLLVVLDEVNSVLSDEVSVQIKEYKKSQAQNIKLKKPLCLEEVYDDEEIIDSLDEDEVIYEEE